MDLITRVVVRLSYRFHSDRSEIDIRNLYSEVGVPLPMSALLTATLDTFFEKLGGTPLIYLFDNVEEGLRLPVSRNAELPDKTIEYQTGGHHS